MGCLAKAVANSRGDVSMSRSNCTTTESGLGEVVRNWRKAVNTGSETRPRSRARFMAAATGSRNSILGGNSIAPGCVVLIKAGKRAKETVCPARNRPQIAKIARTCGAGVGIHLTCAWPPFTFALRNTVPPTLLCGAVLELVERAVRIRSPRNHTHPRSRRRPHDVYDDVLHRGGQSRNLVGGGNSRRTVLCCNRAGGGGGMLFHGALCQPPVRYRSLHGRERVYRVHGLQDAGLCVADCAGCDFHRRPGVHPDDCIAPAPVDCGRRTHLSALQLRRPGRAEG